MAERIRTIRLYGKLGARFGREHHLAVRSAAEALRALGVLYEGFNRFLADAKDMGLVFAVFYGRRNLGKDQLAEPSGASDIRVAPVVQGSKNSGLMQVLTGIAIIVAVTFLGPAGAGFAALGATGTGWAAAGMIGISLALGGVAQMVTGTQAAIDSGESADNKPSYNFSGIKNTVTQGNPVPLCYGEMTAGSAQLSLGVYAEDQQ